MKKFEPIIVGFVCNECAYAAADLAGTTRLSYPPNVRLIRVPCSGQVDMIHILRAFENGADGVFVGGCLKDQCHYVDGNKKAEKRVGFLKDILKAMGMEEERLSIHLLSASMAQEFASLASELTSTLKKLGPSPFRRRRTRVLHNAQKRELFRDMLLRINDGLKAKAREYKEIVSGYGEPIFDKGKCVGCGACGYVCKDGAIRVETKSDKVLIKNTYWRCTACGNCRDACPKECLDIGEEFDLMRFLGGREEVKIEIGMIACERCGNSYLPAMLTNEIEKMLSDRYLSTSFVGLCPTCRKFNQAERIRDAQGSTGRGRRVERLRGIAGGAKRQ